MLLYKFKNVGFKDDGVLTDPEPAHQHKLFLLPKPTGHFLLLIRDSDYTLLFHGKDFFILLNDISGIFGFIHFLGSFVQLFCFDCVIIRERIYQLLFYFFFVESLCLLDVYRAFQLKTKNNQCTINLKHPLQVTRLCWAQSTSFSMRLKVIKILYHKHFCKTVFQINLISKPS